MSQIIEAEIVIIEWEETPISEGRPHSHEHHRHVVDIYNELDGQTYRIHAKDATPIRKVIDKFLERIGRTQQPGDRLICDDGDCAEKSGEDVFQFESLTIEQYLHKAHCPHLNWTFIGDTGGA